MVCKFPNCNMRNESRAKCFLKTFPFETVFMIKIHLVATKILVSITRYNLAVGRTAQNINNLFVHCRSRLVSQKAE